MTAQSVIGLSTYVAYWRPLGEVLRDIAENGYSNVEIMRYEQHLDPKDTPDLKAVKRVLRDLQLRLWSLHCPPHVYVDISSLQEETRKHSVELMRETMRFCAELEGEVVIIHPSKDPFFATQELCSRAFSRAEDSVSSLTLLAEELGIRLAVENLLPALGKPGIVNFACRLSEVIRLVRKINNPHLGVCLDTGHYAVEAQDSDISEGVAQCGKDLFTLHIHDADEKGKDHLPPGQGIIDWPCFLESLAGIGYGGVLMFEVSGSDVDNIIPRSMAAVKAILE